MSKIRLKTWPLIVALVALVGAVASALVLPKLPATAAIAGWPLALNADYIILAFAGLTLIFAAISFLFRSTGEKFEKEPKPAKVVRDVAPKAGRTRRESTVVSPTPASTGFGSAALTPSETVTTPVTKADTKAAKARMVEEEKFRKQAAKEAASAAKKGSRALKRGRKVEDVQVDDHSNGQLTEADLEAIRAGASAFATEPDFVTANTENAQGIASDLDDYFVDPNAAVEPSLDTASEDEADPVWMTAAYEDSTFTVPFGEDTAETSFVEENELAPVTDLVGENIQLPEVPAVEEPSDEENPSEEEPIEDSNLVEEPELPDAAETDFDTNYVAPPADDSVEDQANEEPAENLDDTFADEITNENVPFDEAPTEENTFVETPEVADEALVARISALLEEAQNRIEQKKIADLTAENDALRARLATYEKSTVDLSALPAPTGAPVFPVQNNTPSDFYSTPATQQESPAEMVTAKPVKGRRGRGRHAAK